MRDAIVMAAGEGTRMRPLTDRWPKPVLPVDGRPVIATLLHELAAAGYGRVVVVTGHLAEQVEELVGDGSAFGLELRHARQPEAVGSADAVRRGLAAGAAPPVLVSAADTVFGPGDLRRFTDAFAASGAEGAIAVRRQPAGRQPVKVAGGRIVKLLDDDPSSPFSAAPLWALGPELVPLLETLTGPPYALADAFEAALAAGLELAAVEIGRTRDLTFPVDLVTENFPYLSS